MIGYIVQIGEEYLNFQCLSTPEINDAIILSTEEDAIAVACGQDVNAKVIEHEYHPTHPTASGKAGTYWEYHAEVG